MMNWKLLLIALSLIVGVSARPAEESQVTEEPTTMQKSPEVTISPIVESPTTVTEPSTTKKAATTLAPATKATEAPSTVRPKTEGETDEKRELKTPIAIENRELKVSSNLQMTGGNSNEILVKDSSFHRGVAVPMTMEDLEKEMEREKELLNKAKKKIAMESSTAKDGISTWILLSGSNAPTGRPEMRPSYRIDPDERKPLKDNNITTTTKKRLFTTTMKTPKPTQKYNNNKLITRVKVTSSNEAKIETEDEVTTKAPVTTKKAQLTTKARKYTTVRPKTTTTTRAPSTTTTEEVEVIDDDTDEEQSPSVETSTFLIMEAKDADFNLPSDRSPKPTSIPTKKSKTTTTKSKKKKKIATTSTNSTRIKKKSDKTKLTKLSKNPEKPITTQIYNYLAREVMPTVGVGLVGLVVTAGLATYFLGGPLTALRRSYDISNRRDDVAYDRSDDFGGNTQNEEEMFGKVIAGMPENSAYRNNLRVNSYRPKAQPYSGYTQYSQQSPKYAAQQHLRYRAVDPYQASYQQSLQSQYPQYYQSATPAETQAKSSVPEYGIQAQPQQPAASQNFNVDSLNQMFIDSVDMTTNAPSEPVYNNDYDEIAQSYFPQQEKVVPGKVNMEKQQLNEYESQPENEVSRSEKITIVKAQSVPNNHRTDGSEQSLPTPAALTSLHPDEEYQNSIANAIMNQKNQFVVGSVVAENFEETPPSIVPEHGPRKRREALRKAAKSLDNNEIEDDDQDDKIKRETETTTFKSEETPSKEELPSKDDIEASSATDSDIAASENQAESTTQYPNYTYNIENSQNNIFHLFRRIIDLKLRLGLNFLQNATVAFQHYLRGVEKRVNTSPLFNPYVKNETAASEASNAERKSNKLQRQKVEPL